MHSSAIFFFLAAFTAINADTRLVTPTVSPPFQQVKFPGNAQVRCVFPHRLVGCRVRITRLLDGYTVDELVDFSQGSLSPDKTLRNLAGNRAYNVKYHGNGLAEGHCGVQVGREQRYDVLTLVVCHGQHEDLGWSRGSAMVVFDPYDILPTTTKTPRLMVTAPGEDVTLLFTAQEPLDRCQVLTPGTGWVLLNQDGTLSDTQRFRPHGLGMLRGQCGFVWTNVTQKDAGITWWFGQKKGVREYSYQANIVVILAAPVGDPVLQVRDLDSLRVGSLLQATCRAPPASPPANLTWLLDGHVVRRDQSNDTLIGDLDSAFPWQPQPVVQTFTRNLTGEDTGKRLECRVNHEALSLPKSVAIVVPATASCLPACENNGTCTAPNQCTCTENFEGPQCQVAIRLCPDYPALPANSRRECSSKTCTFTCTTGFRFPDGSTVANASCRDGSWVLSRTEWLTIPGCLPTCDPLCVNGGDCQAPNVCRCPREYTGPQCQYSKAPGRLGCFEDNGDRVMKNSENRHATLTATACKHMCQEFKYAGLQDSSQCICDDQLPTKTVPDSRCGLPCAGNSGQSCGGSGTLEVFAVEPKPAMQGKPLGCFENTPSIWTSGKITMQNCTPQRCFNACRGFRFAALQNGHVCYCGDARPMTALPDSRCRIQCNSLAGKPCGGETELGVFELSDGPVTVACATSDYQIQGDLGTYKLFTVRKIWEDAWQQCEDDQAHLVIINSEDEAKFVRTLFAQVPFETRMHAGFHDQLRKGAYRTLSGETLSSAGYDTWSTQYPAAASPVKHCGSLDVNAHLAQIDGNCDAQAVFVCEKKSGPRGALADQVNPRSAPSDS